MKFRTGMPPSNFTEKQKTGLSPEKKLFSELRVLLKSIYKTYQDPNQRITEILKIVEPFLKRILYLPNEKIEEMRTILNNCTEAKDEEQFLHEIIESLKPFFAIIGIRSRESEEVTTHMKNEESGRLELNRLVAYNKVGDTIYLHHNIAITIGPKRELYYDAMRQLAKIVDDDKEIQKIEAISWIVFRMITFFTRNGFVIEKLDKTDSKGREEAKASISREEFLRRFLERE